MPAILTDAATCTCDACGGIAAIGSFVDFDHDWTPITVAEALCLDCGETFEPAS